jgi:hypothetical protein
MDEKPEVKPSLLRRYMFDRTERLKIHQNLSFKIMPKLFSSRRIISTTIAAYVLYGVVFAKNSEQHKFSVSFSRRVS